MNYTPRHMKRNKTMERIHTIIRITIWSSIVITAMLLTDWIGRVIIESTP